MATPRGLALRCGMPLLCVLVVVLAGCKSKQPAKVPVSAGRNPKDPAALLVPGRTMEMTVKVFQWGKGRGPLLRETKKTVSTTGPTQLPPIEDKSIGKTWTGAVQYQVEYHWPIAGIGSGNTEVVPGVELTHAIKMDKSWPYQISHGEDATHVILKGGMAVHVIRLSQGWTSDDVIDAALAWMDRDVAARLARYAGHARK